MKSNQIALILTIFILGVAASPATGVDQTDPTDNPIAQYFPFFVLGMMALTFFFPVIIVVFYLPCIIVFIAVFMVLTGSGIVLGVATSVNTSLIRGSQRGGYLNRHNAPPLTHDGFTEPQSAPHCEPTPNACPQSPYAPQVYPQPQATYSYPNVVNYEPNAASDAPLRTEPSYFPAIGPQ